MQNFPNKKDRILVLALWFVFFLPAVCSLIFLTAFQDLPVIITAAISIPGTIFLSVLIPKVGKGYFLKYMFNKKEFNKLKNQALEKFKGATDSFIKELEDFMYNQYMMTGKVFYYPTVEDDKWLLSSVDNIQGLIWLIDILNKSIVDKRGFNYFIDMSYAVSHNGELAINTLNNGFLSGELRYLLIRVYVDTKFNLEDNGLSEEYTKKNQELRDKMIKEYDPILNNFEEEVESIYNKIKDKGPTPKKEKEEIVS